MTLPPDELSLQTRRTIRRLWYVPALIGAVVILIFARFNGWPDTIIGRDINQHRANIPAPIPTDGFPFSQTFQSNKDGLHELELIVYRNGEDSAEDSWIALELVDETGAVVVSEQVATRDLVLNQSYTLTFAPQERSFGRDFTLRVTGHNNTAVTFWAFNLDSVANGQLNSSENSDLRLISRYTLTSGSALRVLLRQFRAHTPLILLSGLMLWLPGAFLRHLLANVRRAPVSTGDAAVNAALDLSLGIALWPLLWLWLTAVGGNWSPLGLQLFLIVLLAGTLILAVRAPKPIEPQLTRHHSILFLTLFLAFNLRMLAVRDMAFPAWVDSTRHALITAIMARNGTFLIDYEPFFEAALPIYHYGFHTLSAGILLLTDGNMADILLYIGQLLNALVPLTVYAATWMLSRRRSAALFAAFVVALPFFFPAYYLSWGRLTQLTGVLILPLLLATTLALSREDRSQFSIYEFGFTVLLAAGLFLVHFRVFLVYLPFALIAWLVGLRRRQTAIRLPLAGALTGLLVLPRIVQLLQIVRPESLGDSPSGYNNFPSGYVTTGWESELLIGVVAVGAMALLHLAKRFEWLTWLLVSGLLAYTAAGEWLGSVPILLGTPFLRSGALAGLLAFTLNGWEQDQYRWTLPFVIWLSAEYHLSNYTNSALLLAGLIAITLFTAHVEETDWSELILLLAAWIGLLFFVLLGSTIGLPETWVINLNSMYITLFVPYAMILGIGFAVLWHGVRGQQWFFQLALYGAMGCVLTAFLLFGTHNQITILNEATVLAEPADAPALQWLDENVPDDATVAVNSWKWLGFTWAAQDGGAWIMPLAGRFPSTPPADYIYNDELVVQVEAFNVAAQQINDWSSAEAIQFLRDNDMTHVFVGARGGFIKPDQLATHPAAELLYANDGAFIFAIAAE